MLLCYTGVPPVATQQLSLVVYLRGFGACTIYTRVPDDIALGLWVLLFVITVSTETFSVTNYLPALSYKQSSHPSLPASACHPEKPSLFSCTATTMTRLRGTLTPVKRPRAPAGMASPIVPFTEVIAEETERKSESGLLPPPLKAKFRFFLLVCHQVTYKWSLMKTAVKLVFILSHYSV